MKLTAPQAVTVSETAMSGPAKPAEASLCWEAVAPTEHLLSRHRAPLPSRPRALTGWSSALLLPRVPNPLFSELAHPQRDSAAGRPALARPVPLSLIVLGRVQLQVRQSLVPMSQSNPALAMPMFKHRSKASSHRPASSDPTPFACPLHVLYCGNSPESLAGTCHRLPGQHTGQRPSSCSPSALRSPPNAANSSQAKLKKECNVTTPRELVCFCTQGNCEWLQAHGGNLAT